MASELKLSKRDKERWSELRTSIIYMFAARGTNYGAAVDVIWKLMQQWKRADSRKAKVKNAT